MYIQKNLREKMKKLSITLSILILLIVGNLTAQDQPVYPQPIDLITIPTAGIIPRGAYSVNVRLSQNGGLMTGISAGISSRFMFGISYGGSQIIGDQKIIWNAQPGVEIKYRFSEENTKLPAVLLGFNSQGFGTFIDSTKRYETKAKGFYVVASKNYHFLGNLGIHAGVNYNPIEDGDGDKDPSFFIGLDKDINPEISLVVEYDAALNDNETNEISLGKGTGYLNAGIRWTLVQHFHFELDFNNILLNRKSIDYLTRELKITFVEFF